MFVDSLSNQYLDIKPTFLFLALIDYIHIDMWIQCICLLLLLEYMSWGYISLMEGHVSHQRCEVNMKPDSALKKKNQCRITLNIDCYTRIENTR